MSRRDGPRWTARALAPLALALIAACGGESPTVPVSDEPFLYLVLNQRSISHYGDMTRPLQHAILLSSGSPLEAPQYRAAELFEMRRVQDGARFDWRQYSAERLGTPGTHSGITLQDANFYLPDAVDGGPGTGEIRPGESYEITVRTGGGELHGITTVPAAFRVRLMQQDGHRTAFWPRVAGAAAYLVGVYPYPAALQTDTSYAVPDDAPEGEFPRVTAVDANLYRYLADGREGRAGIDRGYGVFGAVTVGER